MIEYRLCITATYHGLCKIYFFGLIMARSGIVSSLHILAFPRDIIILRSEANPMKVIHGFICPKYPNRVVESSFGSGCPVEIFLWICNGMCLTWFELDQRCFGSGLDMPLIEILFFIGILGSQ